MPKVVLFVEDDDDIREVFAFRLRHDGFAVVESGRAAVALEALERGPLPDVILLDMFMPPGEMTGIELLTRLRERAAWAGMPVVVFSGFGEILNRDLMARLGVRTVLLKADARDGDVIQAIREALHPDATTCS